MNNREFWLKMGYGETEVDEWLLELAEDRAARKAWWDGLSEDTQAQITREIVAEEERLSNLDDCPVNFEMWASRTVFARHGFKYPHDNPVPRMSEKQRDRFVELVLKADTLLEQVTITPMRPMKKVEA